ncbi:hypothetical protein BKA70DRAFT_514965 [Coprinopsis sp. MPI-PUGE-AT-0042]|nr:hypothetical protein BKA70DRAFT_514965 [Coprinopsis sp. MPI-PUGE-AT-0042]
MSRSFMKMAYAPLALMLVVLALMSATSATETTPPAIPPSQCSSKDFQCCKLVGSSDDGVIGHLLNTLGIVLTPVAEFVGITCTPIDILDITQPSKCQDKPLCCSGRNISGVLGLVAIGCNPIEIL